MVQALQLAQVLELSDKQLFECFIQALDGEEKFVAPLGIFPLTA